MRRTVTWIVLLGALVGVSFLVFQIVYDPSPTVDPTASGPGAERAPIADPALVGRPLTEAPPRATGYGIHGMVRDETGRGVAGVPVIAFRQPRLVNLGRNPRERLFAPLEAASSRGTEEARVTSGADGRFRISELDAEVHYTLEARPAAPLAGSTRNVTAGAGRLGPVVLVVRSGHPLRVRVVDAQDQGLFALVAVRTRDDDASGAEYHGARVRTDADGRLAIASVPAGPIWIHVLVPGRIHRGFPAHLPHPEELVLRMFDPNGATVHGTATNVDEEPVSGARIVVEARARRADEPPGSTALTTTAADGTWRVEGLPPAELGHVAAEAEGYRVVEVDGHGRRLQAGGELFVPVVLHRGATVHGLVVDPARKPLAGAEVQLRIFASGAGCTHEATSDAEGRFVLSAIQPGSIAVSAYRDGYYQPSQTDGAGRLQRAGELVLRPLGDEVKELTIVLHPGIAVRGRVVDGQGMPVPGAMVRAKGSGDPNVEVSVWSWRGRFETKTDAEGSFLFAGLAPGEVWVFHAETPYAFGGARLDAPLTDAGVPDVEIVLRPTGVLAGRVVDGEGVAIARALVDLRPGKTRQVSAADGAFHFERVPAGSWVLSVWDPWGSVEIGSPRRIELDWGDVVQDVLVEARTALPIAGRLVDADGDPVPHADLRFELVEPKGKAKGLTVTDAAGHFTVGVWGVGTYGARHEGLPFPNRITPPDTNVVLELTDPAGDVVTFRIVAPDGTLVPKARLIVGSGYGDGFRRTRHEVDGGIVAMPRHKLPGPTFVEVEWARDAAGTRLNLRDLARTQVDTAGSEVVLELERGRVLRGTVTSNTGVPIPNANAYATVPGERKGEGARTDASGRFEITALPHGELEATASVGMGTSPYLPCDPVRVSAGQEEVDLELVEGVMFTVRVLDPDGEGLGGASVDVRALRKGQQWGRRGQTDGDGVCRLGGLAADATFTIGVRTTSFPRVNIADVPYGTGETTVHLVSGVTIEGTVVDEAGQSVAGAWINAKALDARTSGNSGRTEGNTNRFELSALQPGRYALTASVHGRFAESKPVQVTAPAQGVRLVVRPIREVKGRVTGENLHRAVGTWWIGDSMTSIRIEADGSFEVPRTADDPGSFLVLNFETGEYGFLENIKPSDGPFNVTMRPGKVLAGRIEGYEERGSRRVHLTFLRGPIRWGGTPEPDGTFEQKCVPPGPWRVEVRADGKVAGVDLDVAPGAGRVDLVLTLPE